MILKRTISEQLLEAIEPNKVVLLYGPRRVGKTFLLKQLSEEFKDKYQYKYVTGEDRIVRDELSSEIIERLKSFIGSATLLVIDEAHRIPNIGLNLKLIVDNIPGISVIASGSASFELAKQVGEPLTGRKKTLKLFPISTKEVIDNFDIMKHKSLLDEEIIFGGYPELYQKKTRQEKENYLRELVDSILLRDILEIENIRNSKKLLDLLTLLAFQIGKEVSMHELGNNLDLHKDTVYKYLDLLEKSFILINIRGFARNLRKEVSKTSRYYFYDNGIRNALINNFNQLKLRDDVGQLWENYLVIERLKKQNYEKINSNNYFWRTYQRKEIDWVEERDGKLFGYEFKSGAKTVSAPKDWSNAYPNAKFEVINKENYLDFVN